MGGHGLPKHINPTQLLQAQMRIPLSCPKFDRLLGGGIESGCVTLLYGEAGAGKTNVCLQAAREVAENGSRVAYIDNEGLSPERLMQVFSENEDAMRNLLIFQIHSLEEQTDRIEKIGKLAENKAISLVVIDSLTMFYRLRHDEPKARNEFVKQTEMLLEIARKYDMTILVTSQVYSNLTAWSSSEAMRSTTMRRRSSAWRSWTMVAGRRSSSSTGACPRAGPSIIGSPKRASRMPEEK